MSDFDPEQEVLTATQWCEDVLYLAGREDVRVTHLRVWIRSEVERRRRLCSDDYLPYPFEAVRHVDENVALGLSKYGFSYSILDELKAAMEECVFLQEHHQRQKDDWERKRTSELYWESPAGRVMRFLFFLLVWGVPVLWVCSLFSSVCAFSWGAGLIVVMSLLMELGIYLEVTL